jgi:DNA invertase Pin-like site-specific DNA recombinase
MKNGYANARDVLPQELLAQVQEHWSGLLWVPSRNTFYLDRKKLVRTLKAEGVASKEIARLAGVSTRRVNQILQEEREESRQFPAPSGM